MKFAHSLAALTLLASAAMAGPAPLVAQDAWIRAVPGADMAAAYLTLRNVSANSVTVTGIECSSAGHAMVHETRIEGGRSSMRPHEQIVVAAGSVVKLEPGGLHVMLHDLKKPLVVGETVPLVVRLAGGASVQVMAVVRPLGAAS